MDSTAIASGVVSACLTSIILLGLLRSPIKAWQSRIIKAEIHTLRVDLERFFSSLITCLVNTRSPQIEAYTQAYRLLSQSHRIMPRLLNPDRFTAGDPSGARAETIELASDAHAIAAQLKNHIYDARPYFHDDTWIQLLESSDSIKEICARYNSEKPKLWWEKKPDVELGQLDAQVELALSMVLEKTRQLLQVA